MKSVELVGWFTKSHMKQGALTVSQGLEGVDALEIKPPDVASVIQALHSEAKSEKEHSKRK